MKSQRRHDLKDNALARKIYEIPTFGAKYGLRILLGVILVLLLVILIRQRMNYASQLSNRLAMDLSSSQTMLAQLRNLDPTDPSFINLRDRLRTEIDRNLNDLIKTSTDPNQLAQAYLAKGDLCWKLANLPTPPPASTQPSPAADLDINALLSESSDAYNTILHKYLQSNVAYIINAYFGLAYIAENRGDWNAARNYLVIVNNNSSYPASFRQEAYVQMGLLDQMQRQAIIGTAATQPASRPAITPIGPAAPKTQPATQQSH